MVSFSSLGAGWVFIAILVIVVIAVVALVQKRQSMATSVVKLVFIFLVVSIGYTFIVNHVQLTSLNSVIDGTKIYFNWLMSIFDKTVDVTSYAVKQNWTSNSTIGK
jgi:disulfide bond formation protein DsbB